MPIQPPEPPRQGPPTRRFPEVVRDDGMARTRLATRWIAIGGLAGVAVFAGLAAASTHHASAKPDQTPAVDQPDTTQDPATTPATDAPATTPSTATPTTVAPATQAPATQAPATTPRVTTPAT